MAEPRQMVRKPSSFQAAAPVLRTDDREYFRQPLYDRVNLPVSLSGDVSFFTVPNGGSATLIRFGGTATVNKTYRDTNLPSQNQDPNRDYAVYGCAIGLVPASHTVTAATAATIRVDKDNIKENGSLVVKVSGNKEILRIPLIGIPELNAESAVASTATGSTVFGGPIGSRYGFYPLTTRRGQPMLITKGTILQVTMTFDGTTTLTQSFDAVLWIDSDQRRSV